MTFQVRGKVYESYEQFLAENLSVFERVSDIFSGLAEKLPDKRKWVTKQVTFKYSVPAATGISLEDKSLITGEITQVALHFPDGCDARVSVAFGHEQKWTCPSTPDTYIALNDTTPVFTFINEQIHRDDILWVVIKNTDASNAHTITVIATLEGVETPFGALL